MMNRSRFKTDVRTRPRFCLLSIINHIVPASNAERRTHDNEEYEPRLYSTHEAVIVVFQVAGYCCTMLLGADSCAYHFVRQK